MFELKAILVREVWLSEDCLRLFKFDWQLFLDFKLICLLSILMPLIMACLWVSVRKKFVL